MVMLESLGVGGVVGLVIMGGLVILSIPLMPKYWRGEYRQLHDRGSSSWWVWGDALRRGFLRGLHIGVVAAAGVSFAVVFHAAADAGVGWAGPAGWIAFGLFGGCIAVDLLVVLVNRPRWLVPPHARNEPGP